MQLFGPRRSLLSGHEILDPDRNNATLIGWYDFSREPGVDGGSLSQLTDFSGNGRNAGLYGSGNDFCLSDASGYQNHLRTGIFNSSKHFRVDMPFGSTCCVLVVGKFAIGSGYFPRIWSQSKGTAASPDTSPDYGTTGVMCCVVGTLFGQAYQVATNGYGANFASLDGDDYISTSEISPENGVLSTYNGMSPSSEVGTRPVSQSNLATVLWIGDSNVGGTPNSSGPPTDGKLYEIRLYSMAPSMIDRSKFLRNKWGF